MTEEREKLLIKLMNAYKALEFKEQLSYKNDEYKQLRNSAVQKMNSNKEVLSRYKERIRTGPKIEKSQVVSQNFERKEIKRFIILTIIGVLLIFLLQLDPRWLIGISLPLARWYATMIPLIIGVFYGVIFIIILIILAILGAIVGEIIGAIIGLLLGVGIIIGFSMIANTTLMVVLGVFLLMLYPYIRSKKTLNQRREEQKELNERIEIINRKIQKHNQAFNEAKTNLNRATKAVEISESNLKNRDNALSEAGLAYDEYITSNAYKESLAFLSNERNLSLETISVMYYIVSSGRADTFKEMLNKYDSLVEHQDLMKALNILNIGLNSIQETIAEGFNRLSSEINQGLASVNSNLSTVNTNLLDINENITESRKQQLAQTAALIAEQERATQTLKEIDKGLDNQDLGKAYK